MTDVLIEPVGEVPDCPQGTEEVRMHRFVRRTMPVLTNLAAFSLMLP